MESSNLLFCYYILSFSSRFVNSISFFKTTKFEVVFLCIIIKQAVFCVIFHPLTPFLPKNVPNSNLPSFSINIKVTSF